MQRLVALILIIVLLPFWLIIGVVQLFVFQNIIFSQLRSGKHGKPFRLLKFQSLTTQKEEESDRKRLNTWGRILRVTSVDETPQLLNIIKGEMAFVGPRPLLPEYLRLYSSRQNRRHEVKPGITGWAQVKGRNNLSWKEQFELDVWYVDHQSWLLDLKILWKTFFRITKPSRSETQIREAYNGKN